MTSQNNSDLAFLDVLLVNAEKYNQVFIQKTKPSWINQILPRLARSSVHFNKMFEILVDMVVSERHPDWAKRALQWLIKILDNPETVEMAKQCSSSMHRFVSYCVEMNGVENIVNSTLKYINYERENKVRRRKRGGIIVVCTKYLFIDDPHLNFGAIKKRFKKEEESGIAGSSEDLENSDGDDEMSELGSEDGSYASVSEDDNASEISEDDGVFDVDRNSISSFTESQNSNSFPQPRTARTLERMEDNSDSDAQIGTDENVSENEESGEEEDSDDELNINRSFPSSSSSEDDSEDDHEEDGNAEKKGSSEENEDEADDDASDSEAASGDQESERENGEADTNMEEVQQPHKSTSGAAAKSVFVPRRSSRIRKQH